MHSKIYYHQKFNNNLKTQTQTSQSSPIYQIVNSFLYLLNDINSTELYPILLLLLMIKVFFHYNQLYICLLHNQLKQNTFEYSPQLLQHVKLTFLPHLSSWEKYQLSNRISFFQYHYYMQ